jgi:hypothetical protein
MHNSSPVTGYQPIWGCFIIPQEDFSIERIADGPHLFSQHQST